MHELNNIDYLKDLEIEQPEVILQIFSSDGELKDTYVGYTAIEDYIDSQEWKIKKEEYNEAKSNNNKESSEEVF